MRSKRALFPQTLRKWIAENSFGLQTYAQSPGIFRLKADHKIGLFVTPR